MSQEINVISRTQIVTVDKPSGTVVVGNAGATGPMGPAGPPGSDGDAFWEYISGTLSPKPETTTPLTNFGVATMDGGTDINDFTTSGEIVRYHSQPGILFYISHSGLGLNDQGVVALDTMGAGLQAGINSGPGSVYSNLNLTNDGFLALSSQSLYTIFSDTVDPDNETMIRLIDGIEFPNVSYVKDVLEHLAEPMISQRLVVDNTTVANFLQEVYGDQSTTYIKSYQDELDQETDLILFAGEESAYWEISALDGSPGSLKKITTYGDSMLVSNIIDVSGGRYAGFQVHIEDMNTSQQGYHVLDMGNNWFGILLDTLGTEGSEIMIRTQDRGILPESGGIAFDSETDFDIWLDDDFRINAGGFAEINADEYISIGAGGTSISIDSFGIGLYPNGEVWVGGQINHQSGVKWNRSTKTAAYTTTELDNLIVATANTFTIKLGDFTEVGMWQIIANEGAGTLTVSVTTGKKLNNITNGTATLTQGQAKTYYCDGAGNWWSAS